MYNRHSAPHTRRRSLFAALALGTAALAVVLAGCSQSPFAPPAASGASWVDQDVGTVGTQGLATSKNGGQSWVIQGAGKDITDTNDSFNYNYTRVTGNVAIQTRVADVQKVSSWTKAGVMIRASVKDDAANVAGLLTAANGSIMQHRATSGATTKQDGADTSVAAPYWLRLQRIGTTFTAYESADGTTWTKLGSVDLTLPDKILVGLAVSSQNDATLATAVFDNTTVVTGAAVTDPNGGGTSGGGTSGGTTSGGTTSGSTTSGTTTISYQPDTSNFSNPGRGFYNEPYPGNWSATTSAGYSLAMRYVRLDNYTSGPLPSSFLSSLQSELQGVRSSGVKLILRFAYNRSAGSDAPLNIVLEHINQLKPILQQYSDVIAVVQAGFIGQWGEWHNSTNNLLTLSNRTQIVSALLGAVPTSRDVDIRTPYWISDIYPTGVTAETAFTGTNVSRLGQHNDCFLSSSNDAGTYQSTGDRTYAQNVSAYTAMGGETCSAGGLTSYNDCPSALNAMATYHWDYLNAEYYSGILDKWKSQGCYTEIAKRLGYRYVVNSFTTPTSLSPGASLSMSLNITNDGFGKLYNPRPMQLVLLPTDGSAGTYLTINSDARKVLPGPGQTVDIPIDMTLPSSTPAGTYNVYVNLPDASPNLSSNPAYSIRLADAGMWMQYSGFNYLNTQITVP